MASPDSQTDTLPHVDLMADEDPKSPIIHSFLNSIPGSVPTDVLLWGNRSFLYYDSPETGYYRYVECTFTIAPLTE